MHGTYSVKLLVDHMDTIFSSSAKKGGNISLSNYRNFPCGTEIQTYFCFQKRHPINCIQTELGLDERCRPAERKASYKIAQVAISPRVKRLECDFKFVLGLRLVSAFRICGPVHVHPQKCSFCGYIRFFNPCFLIINFQFEIF